MPGSPIYGGRYLLGDATYGARRKGAMYGDPGFGALIGAAGRYLAPGLVKVAQGAKRLLKGAPKAAGGAATGTAIATIPAATSTIRRVAGPIAAIGAGTAAGELAINMMGVGGVSRRSYRRMNPLNPKALKRATRRLAGFHTFAESTEKELRKLAPMKRSCAPRRKACR